MLVPLSHTTPPYSKTDFMLVPLSHTTPPYSKTDFMNENIQWNSIVSKSKEVIILVWNLWLFKLSMIDTANSPTFTSSYHGNVLSELLLKDESYYLFLWFYLYYRYMQVTSNIFDVYHDVKLWHWTIINCCSYLTGATIST